GVGTSGAALRLPRAGFARRVGSEQLAMLDGLTGRMPEARVTFHAPERFRRRRELDCELENHALLLAALAPLFADLGAFLRARQCGVVELECRLTHRHVPATRCVVRLAAPATDVHRLAGLLGERLNALDLPGPARPCELRAGLLHRHPAAWRPSVGVSRARRAPSLVSARRVRMTMFSAGASREAALPEYAELHCLSNFTYLRGASHPHELVEQADSLGYAA